MDADNHEMPANRTLKHLFYLQKPDTQQCSKVPTNKPPPQKKKSLPIDQAKLTRNAFTTATFQELKTVIVD